MATPIFFILTTLLLPPWVAAQTNSYEVYYQWNQIDFSFPNDSVRNELIQNGGYQQINCVPTGVKIFRDRIFLATPRYHSGVPSTLNVISYQKSASDLIMNNNRGPRLTPFPSWEMQEEGNCNALQNVQAMELDPYNRLWIVDTGRTDLLTASAKNLCPHKLVIYDLIANRIDRVYQFPNQVAPSDTAILKDIQVACSSRLDCHGYVSNLNGTCSIVVYDYRRNDSWSATHSSMQPDPSRQSVVIEGTTAVVPFGITALGLTPKATNYSTLYFSKLAGDHIYSLPTSIVRDAATLKQNPILPDSAIRDLGVKPMGQADGSAMDNQGRWYFGSLPESAVYSINTNSNVTQQLPGAMRAVQNTRDMQWPDTFSFDGMGYLLYTTTRFQLFNAMMTNPQEVNYRLIRFRTGTSAYSA